MSVTQRIIKNTLFLISGQVVAKLINLALVLILARIFGVNGFGIYSFAFAYTSLFMFFAHLGINSLLVREVARNKDEAGIFISNTLPVLLIMSIFLLFLINTISVLSDWGRLEKILIFIFTFYFIFETMCRYFIAVIRAHEKMEYEAMITVGERLLMLAVTILIWIFDLDLIVLVSGYTLIQLSRLLWLRQLIQKKFVPFRLSWNRERVFSILKEAYPFALMSIFATISTRIDLVMIRIFHTPDMVGIYNAGRKLIESLTFIPENIYFAVFPVLAVYYLKDRSYFDLTFQRMFLMLCILALPISSAIFIFAPDIIGTFFEPEFAATSVPLQWLAIALGFIFIRHAFAVTLNSTGKQHIFSVITGIGMVINVSLNLLLIPRYDVLGAALATLFSESTITIAAYIYMREMIRFDSIFPSLIRLVFATFLFTVGLIFLHALPLVIAAVAGTIFYVLLIFLFRIFSRKDFEEIKFLVNRKSRNPMTAHE